jgi:hypothetical protein
MKSPFPRFRPAIAALAFALVGVASCDTSPTPPPDPSTARLVVCPTTTTRSTQAIIGPLGGLVNLGNTIVGIPAGALSVPTLITVTIPASQYMEVRVQANDITELFRFNKDIGIRIDYSRCTDPALATTKVNVWHIREDTKELLEFMGGVDNKSNRTVEFSTDHLSAYAVAF